MNQTIKFNTEVFTFIEVISNNNQLTISFLSPLTCEEIETIISNTANTSVIEVETVISDTETTKVYHKGFTSFNGIRKTTLSSGTMYTVYLSQPSLQKQMAEVKEMISAYNQEVNASFDELMTVVLPQLESLITGADTPAEDSTEPVEGGE